MRILLTELRRVLSQRFTLLCILGGAALGALFPCTNLRNPDRTIEQLFGTPGIIYGLFLVMAMMVVPLGRDFTQRTFQQKIAQGGRRVPLVLAAFSVSLLGAAGGALVFPVSAVLFTRIYSGWQTKHGQNLGYLLADNRFHTCLLAYGAGLLAAGTVCFLITALCRDLVKSLGISTGYVVLLVMLSQKALDGENLAVFRNFFKWTPVYQLLAGIRQVLITSADMQFLLVISGLTLLVTGAASCVALFHAKLK